VKHTIYSNTMFSKAKSLKQNTVAQVYTDGQFDWYSLVWYIDNTKDTATSRRKICRWIGVAGHFGSGLTYYVLPKSCLRIVHSSVMPLTREKLQSPEVKALIAEYYQKVNEKIGNNHLDEEVLDDFPFMPPVPTDIFIDDDPEFDPVEETGPEADNWTPEAYDIASRRQKLSRDSEASEARRQW
jgi:hypothetical protein